MAMKYLRHPEAVLIFMGSGAFKSELQQVAKQLPKGRILFKSAVPQEELLYWVCTADIGVIPYPAVDLNTINCTPNKLFEYIQSGVPILANDLPELRRCVQDTGFGRVTPMTSPEKIAEALDAMLEDPETVTAMKRTLQERNAEFSWDVQAEEYCAEIEKLFADKK